MDARGLARVAKARPNASWMASGSLRTRWIYTLGGQMGNAGQGSCRRVK